MQLKFEETWRWYGPEDPISLQAIKQTGATGIVTALHHIPNGAVWSIQEIMKRKNLIEATGLRWSVVESVPVHEDIKRQSGAYRTYVENYKQTLINLGSCGIRTVCYNFMPVLDWTRTSLNYQLEDGSRALFFDATALAAFDLFLLERPEAIKAYSKEMLQRAKQYFETLDVTATQVLIRTILAGLPGAEEGYSLTEFRKVLASYKHIDHARLQQHLFAFVQEVVPVAEQEGVMMCIHPDDPPFEMFGLPRVVSTHEDIKALYAAVNSRANGLTFCTGSLGVNPENDLPKMVTQLGDRIHFVHLRSTSRDAFGNFYEANHLEGDADMYQVMTALIQEQLLRKQEGRPDVNLPFRPDHGHQMLDDLQKKTNPGYSLIGRMRGLAELRGLEYGIRRSLEEIL